MSYLLFTGDYKHSESHILLNCQLQKLLIQLNKFKHNCSKSAIALAVWIGQNKQIEVKEEATEIQRIISVELTKIIELTNTCKTDSSKLLGELHDLQGKNKKLKEELQLKTQQCSCLKIQMQQLDLSSFDSPMMDESSTPECKKPGEKITLESSKPEEKQ